jgi:hypothetical protein
MAVTEGPSLILLAAGRARRFGGIKPLAPVGPNGEAVIDLAVSDAVTAGFGHIVVVLNPETGPIIQEHISSSWPSWVTVSFATQAVPRGTVDAVNAARDEVDRTLPFGVVNADDLYGIDALKTAVTTLSSSEANMLVGFRLDRAIFGPNAVTRGICEIEDGRLLSIRERRSVSRDGDHFVVNDGELPDVLDGDRVVSMNLWGFQPRMWDVLEWAMEDATDASEEQEVLLPELVGRLIAGELDEQFPGLGEVIVATTTDQCVGVTHPDDLGSVQEEILAQIERGQRQADIFAAPEG